MVIIGLFQLCNGARMCDNSRRSNQKKGSDNMSDWKQAGKTIKATGEKTITYEKAGNPNRIESRKERTWSR